MQRAIEHEFSALGGHYACIVIRLDQSGPQEIVSINPNVSFPAASLAKVPILIEVARQVVLGTLRWEARYIVPDNARVPSAGVLGYLSSDLQPSLHDLAHLMIAISDNTAANMLLDLVGMTAVNNTLLQLGLTSTRLERHFMDFTALQAGLNNWTSAGDMAVIFSYLCTEIIPHKERILSMLLQQNENSMLSAYWGEAVPFAHKTGELDDVLHDAGVVYPPQTPHEPIIAIILTAGQRDKPLTRYVLARVGGIIYHGL